MNARDKSFKVRKWLNRHLLLAVFGGISLVALAGLVCYINAIWPGRLWLRPDAVSEQVIGATQTAIEFVGLTLALTGLSLATYQFALARRVPELSLIFYDPESDSLAKELKAGLRHGAKNFEFSLVNDGDGVARFVVVKVSVPRALAGDAFSNLSDISLRDHTRAMAQRWSAIPTPEWLILKFSGGSEFICHDHSNQGLGPMLLSGFERFGDREHQFDVHYEIRAEGMPWHEDQLKVHLVPGLLQ